jgi:hypothetical protein
MLEFKEDTVVTIGAGMWFTGIPIPHVWATACVPSNVSSSNSTPQEQETSHMREVLGSWLQSFVLVPAKVQKNRAKDTASERFSSDEVLGHIPVTIRTCQGLMVI